MTCCGQQLETERQKCGATAVGEKPEMPDAYKPFRQNMQKEAAQEFFHAQSHQPFLVLVG